MRKVTDGALSLYRVLMVCIEDAFYCQKKERKTLISEAGAFFPFTEAEHDVQTSEISKT